MTNSLIISLLALILRNFPIRLELPSPQIMNIQIMNFFDKSLIYLQYIFMIIAWQIIPIEAFYLFLGGKCLYTKKTKYDNRKEGIKCRNECQ